MKVIRRNVFETNSSSMHTLTTKGEDFTHPLGEVYIVVPQNYEKDGDTLKTPAEKISYLMSLIATYSGFSWWSEEEAIEFSDEEFFSLRDVRKILDLIEKRDSRIIYKRGLENFGHVDHGSVVTLDEFLEENNVDLEEFIFNDKYQLLIVGDWYIGDN